MMESFNTERWFAARELKEFPEPLVIHLNHPVVLCHGYGAIVSLLKPSPLYDVAMLMRSHYVLAYAPNIVPYAKIETRADRWVELLAKITERSGFKKFNVIAHSMGGLDMRYAISKLGAAPYIESFTTISTPHRGTSLAELGLNAPATIRNKLGDFLDWMGNIIYPGDKSDALGSVAQLTRRYVTEQFNPQVPDVKGIPYYSFSAAVGKNTEHPIPVISRYQNNHVFNEEGLNDGFVSIESAKWGEHISTAPLSHMEQINLRVKNDRAYLFEAFWLDVLRVLEEKGH